MSGRKQVRTEEIEFVANGIKQKGTMIVEGTRRLYLTVVYAGERYPIGLVSENLIRSEAEYRLKEHAEGRGARLVKKK